MGPLDNLAKAYLLSELICGTIDANDEVPTTDLMLTEFDFCVRGSPKSRRRLSKKARLFIKGQIRTSLVLTFLAFNGRYMIVWHGGKGSG